MKSNNLKKVAAIGLAAATLMPNVAFAKEFKDVTKTNNFSWAYNYIDVLSDKGVIDGYDDGTFKPERPVSLEETIKLLVEIVNPSETEIKEALDKYGQKVIDSGVRDWAKKYMAVALSRGIVSESVLKNAKENGFFDAKDQKFPVRADVAVFFAKGLGLSNSGDESLLKYKDIDKINSTTKGYLTSLVKENIFESTGSDGNFAGDRYIKRSEMAKITKMSYDYVEKNGVNQKTEKMTGKVLMATKLNGKDVLVLDSNNSNYSFSIDSTTKYKMGEKDAKYEDVKTGQEVEVEYVKLSDADKLGKAKVVTIKNSNLDSVGYVNSVDSSKNEITVRYRSSSKDLNFKTTAKVQTSDTKTFKINKDAKLQAFGNEIKLSTIKSDDLVEFKTNNDNEITELNLFPKDAIVKGEVTYVNNIDRANGTIRLKLKDKKIYEFYTSSETKNLGNIRVGDEVSFNTSYKVILGIGTGEEKDTVIAGEVLNYYEESSYNYNRRASYIRIRRPDGTAKDYDFAYDPIFQKENGTKLSQKDFERELRNSYVKLDLDNRGEVTKVTIIDEDSVFNAVIQIDTSSYDRGNFVGFRGFESEAVVIQSDNRRIRPGNKITINSSNGLDRYSVFKINGLVDRNGKISDTFNEPELLGKPNRELRVDNNIIKNSRDFMTSRDIKDYEENRNNDPFNIYN